MNGRAGAYHNIEDLKDWFFRQSKPYWYLWNSIAPVSTLKPHFRKDANLNVETVEESWTILESALRNTGRFGGDFTVKIDSTNKMNSSMFATISLSLNGNTQGTIASIQGGPIAGYVTSDHFDSWKKEYKADRKIEELESQIDDIKNGEDGIGRILNWTENNPDITSQLIAKIGPGAMNFISGLFGSKTATVGIQGFGSDQVDPHDKVEDPMNNEQQESIADSLARINNHFEDLPSVLKAIADFIDSNPDQAKMFFNGSK